MIIMIILAALVLFELAEEGFEEVMKKKHTYNKVLRLPLSILHTFNSMFKPLISKVLPEKGISATKLSFSSLFFFSLTIPFILGLDDFAGYIPLFTIINVFSFIIGVFLAHTLLNIGLFTSPHLTMRITKNPMVVIIGSIAFVGIGLWGIIEASEILLRLLHL